MRYVVIGTSGAGKSTFAKRLARVTAAPHIELDTLYWMADWQIKPLEQFAADVEQAAAAECWVADGNYSSVRHILWTRATHIVWLNYGRHIVFPRILRRTLHRALTQEVLWHDNRESLASAFLSKNSIILWSLTSYARNIRKYTQLRTGKDYPHLEWIEFTHPTQAERYLQEHQAG